MEAFNNISSETIMCNRTDMEIYTVHIPSILTLTKVLSPIWWAIGIVGNILALLVWLQPKMRHSSGCYLAAMAISDMCFLILNIVYEMNFTYDLSILDKHILCQWFAISYLSVQYMSPVFVLAFTVERYLSVCHPFRMVNFNQSNIKTTIFVILGLALFCVSLHGAQGYFWAINAKGHCDLRPELLASGVWSAYNWTTEILIFAVVPLTVLILNTLVIIEVRNISNLEKQNMRTKSIDRRSTTLMLLGVSFYLIITVLPVTITAALFSKYPYATLNRCLTDEEIVLDADWQSHLSYFSAKLIIGTIGTSHYMINFFIYLLTGKLFRKQLYEMLVVFCCKGKLLYISAKTGVYTNTRTTRMSLTSHRGSIGRGRLNGTVKCEIDPCNNDAEVSNKNGNSTFSGGDTNASNINMDSYTVKNSAAGMKLLPSLEESDVEFTEKDELRPVKHHRHGNGVGPLYH